MLVYTQRRCFARRATMKDFDLRGLLIAAGDGDRGALTQLFEGLWPILVSFTRRGLPTEADAEDASQHAIVKIFAQIGRYDPARDPFGWVLTIAAFEVRTLRRKRQRRRECDTADELELAFDAEDDIVEADLMQRLRSVMQTLPPSDQEALAPILRGGSRATNAPPMDVGARKRRQRAVQRLRQAWKSYAS